MKIKKNDKVIVISGKDKGKSGKVIRVFPKLNKILVENINLKIKHLKKNTDTSKPQGRTQMATPLHISNVKLVMDDGKTSRIGYKVSKDGKKTRVAKINNKEI